MQTNVLNVKMDGIQVKLVVHYVTQFMDHVPNVLKQLKHVQNVTVDTSFQEEHVLNVIVKWQIVPHVHQQQYVPHAQQIIIQLQEGVLHVHQKAVQLVEHQMENVPLVSADITYQAQHAQHVPVRCQIVPHVPPMDQNVLHVKQIIS